MYEVCDIRKRDFSREYTVVECCDSGHRFLSPRLTKGSLESFYSDSYYKMRDFRNTRQLRRYEIQAEYITAKSKGHVLLDVGCAGDDWLKIMQEQGWLCEAVDFKHSQKAIVGVKIHYGYLPEPGLPKNYYDVMTAWGVMEHVLSPADYFCIYIPY